MDFYSNGSSGEGVRLIISEKVAMGILSLLLSALSFGGGYFYGTRKTTSVPVQPVPVEEASSLPTPTQK